LMGADGVGRVVLGPSTSQLVAMLATCLSPHIGPGDEIIVSVANHEANIGPWLRLERHGVRIRWWGVDPESGDIRLDDLRPLLSDKTKVVAFPHTSNLLGQVSDVAEATALAHEAGAKVVVDGVAYAPHALMEVGRWGVDFYAFSAYKVYGPHIAALYGRTEAWAELEGPNHFFVPADEVPRKFELGCLSFEACAGLSAVGDYLASVAGTTVRDRTAVERAYGLFAEWERPLTACLLDYLERKDGVRVIGPLTGRRVPTVSFVSDTVPSRSVVAAVNCEPIGIRNGHMYSLRLAEALGIDGDDGVIRVSAVHYNTVDEIERLCSALDKIL